VEGGGASVSALVVVNSIGDVLAEDNSVLAGTTAVEADPFGWATHPPQETNTVLVAVTCEARLEKREVQWLASRAADGITVAIRPAHTRYDGDIAFAIAWPGPDDGAPPVSLDVLGVLATQATILAIRNAVH
jgi:L-aminopeptidase/D-esterase-like protein